MSFEFDESQLPIVVVRAIGSHSRAEYEAYLQRCGQLNSAQGLIMLFDLRNAALPEPWQIERQAQWLKELRDKSDTTSAAKPTAAYVVSSPAMRFGLSASFNAQPGNPRWHVTEDIGDAMRWCRAILASDAKERRVPAAG